MANHPSILAVAASELCQENAWSKLKSNWLYSLELKMEKLYTISKNKTWI